MVVLEKDCTKDNKDRAFTQIAFMSFVIIVMIVGVFTLVFLSIRERIKR